MSLLTLDHVAYCYQNERLPTVHNINLNIASNSTTVIVGPSGIGKTTLLNLIAGYLPPSQGTLTMNGIPIADPSWERGVVFQSMALYPWLNVRDNILFGPKMRYQSADNLPALLDRAGLRHFANQPIYDLSGGLKQRVALARAFINQPPLLMLDESFSALDNHTRADMHALLFDLWQATQNAVIIITHDLDEALFLGQRIIVMNGHPGIIKATYKNPFFQLAPDVAYADPAYANLRQELLNGIS